MNAGACMASSGDTKFLLGGRRFIQWLPTKFQQVLLCQIPPNYTVLYRWSFAFWRQEIEFCSNDAGFDKNRFESDGYNCAGFLGPSSDTGHRSPRSDDERPLTPGGSPLWREWRTNWLKLILIKTNETRSVRTPDIITRDAGRY